MKNIGFDNEKYLGEQYTAITNRVNRFGNKLYLEFGGKLCFDYHAARVLPGYDPNVKIRLLQMLKDKIDVTSFWTWLIGDYPKSVSTLKENPDFRILPGNFDEHERN